MSNLKLIQEKIAELYQFSKETKVDFSKGWEGVSEKIKKQDQMMDELKQMAKDAVTLVGRVVKFQHADGYAIYVVYKVTKTKASLIWINYSDGWQDDRLGEIGNLPLDYVKSRIDADDAMEKLFS